MGILKKIFAVLLAVMAFFQLMGAIVPALTWVGNFELVTAAMIIQLVLKLAIGSACAFGYWRLTHPRSPGSNVVPAE